MLLIVQRIGSKQFVQMTDLQVELVAGVAPVQLGAGETEVALAERARVPVAVAHLSDHLLVV